MSILTCSLFLVSCSGDEDPAGPGSNTPPKASFAVNPSTEGDEATAFYFDASGCRDAEDAISDLRVRWDWNNDKVWDTGFMTAKTMIHYFPEGLSMVRLMVMDKGGLTDYATTQLNIRAASTGTITDMDGNVYKIVKIGTQWWTAENLKVTHYRNGDAIPNVTEDPAWSVLTSGAYCNYNNDTTLVALHGRLYNWYAATDTRGIAPPGFHVPTEAEWLTLCNYCGGKNRAAIMLKESGTEHWNSPNNFSTNESGFTAIASGARDTTKTLSFTELGVRPYLGTYANYWTSTEAGENSAVYVFMTCQHVTVYLWTDDKGCGTSIRLVRD